MTRKTRRNKGAVLLEEIKLTTIAGVFQVQLTGFIQFQLGLVSSLIMRMIPYAVPRFKLIDMQFRHNIKRHKLCQYLHNFTCSCESDSFTMLQAYINMNNSYTSRQYTSIIPYYSIMCQNKAQIRCF